MKQPKVKDESDILAALVVRGMQDKKAADVVVINLKPLKHAVADYFVIASASSDTHLDAIAQSIEDEVFKATKQHPWQSEGRQNKEWVLLDFVNVVAHVFLRDRRSFYALEELWGDAQIEHIPEVEA